ncbi:hypothetical protein D0X99_17190 [Algoriphagus lacus]|uniref:Uncharacterized protein n=1 Tax=Algoriphagus lacus TaxID=2056311 RepID=A0A418PMX9_9BACT|nr:hypothetical protein [Algoriphagus lacus]RIW13146.1 hypothetical protein D0X99_17190 [Algoriphagus lacus]
MKKLFQFLSKGKNLLLLAGLFLLFNYLLSHFLSKENALDLKFAYSVEEAYLALGNLDLDHRNVYSLGLWLLDTPYMIVYCLLFSGILLKLWGNRKVVFLPVLILTIDFFENLTVLKMLKIFPKENEFLALLSSFFTTSKWIMVAVLIFMILFGLLNFLVGRKILSVNSQKAEI